MLEAVKTNVYIYIAPVITIVTSDIVLKKKITWIAAIGIELTLIDLFLSESKLKFKKRENKMNVENEKCVIVVDENLPIGIIANTAAILGITMGIKMPNVVGNDVLDLECNPHMGIIQFPDRKSTRLNSSHSY